MAVEPRLIPLVGLLALVPVAAYLVNRPELGAMLSVPSTLIIVGSVMYMLQTDTEPRGKVYGPG